MNKDASVLKGGPELERNGKPAPEAITSDRPMPGSLFPGG